MTREEAIQILSTRDAHGVPCGYTSGYQEALDMAIEALQAEPVKHGEWELDPNGMDWNIPAWRCSECRFVANYIGVEVNGLSNSPMNWAGSNFCPNCGAKMNKGRAMKREEVINTLNQIPEACRNCSNHPSNGGSGICHCTLGSMTIT